MTAAELADPVDPAEGWLRMLVAAEIRGVMGRKKITGREMARRLGENPQWAAQRINGAVPLNTNDLPRFAAALEMSIDEMLDLVKHAIKREGFE